jgi:hypothetical protein
MTVLAGLLLMTQLAIRETQARNRRPAAQGPRACCCRLPPPRVFAFLGGAPPPGSAGSAARCVFGPLPLAKEGGKTSREVFRNPSRL